MSEVTTEKKKRGRPRKVVESVFKPAEEIGNSDPASTSKYRGFSGKAVKIRIYRQDGVSDKTDPWVPLSLGDLPQVNVLRGFDWIIPLEYLSVLEDTAVQVPEMDLLKYPNAQGKWWEERIVTRSRFPFQVLGEATWDEYEAFRRERANPKPKQID